MAIREHGVVENLTCGPVREAGLLILAPIFLPGVSVVTRPILKQAIRGAMVAADRAHEVAMWTEGQMNDLVAEVQSERAHPRRGVERTTEQVEEQAGKVVRARPGTRKARSRAA